MPAEKVGMDRAVFSQLKQVLAAWAWTFSRAMTASSRFVYGRMAALQKKLMDGLRDIAGRRGVPVSVQGPTGVFFMLFGVERETIYTESDLEGLDIDRLFGFFRNMQAEGVIVIAGGRYYMSIAHTERDVDQTLEAADRAMAKM